VLDLKGEGEERAAIERRGEGNLEKPPPMNQSLI
jgi:hypothetical protein